MTQALLITDIVHDQRPVFKGRWMSRAVSIKLDSSAAMKLQDNRVFSAAGIMSGEADDRVALAAQRLLEEGAFADEEEDIVVLLTGLDID